MAERKKGSGGKLSRSEVVTVRLDPRLRYGVELAARKHRRTASSFIEWAIEQALQNMVIRDEFIDEPQVTMNDVLTQVWDVDEPDRLVKLALGFPEFLNHQEQVLWKLIRECGLLWRGKYVDSGNGRQWTWRVHELNFIYEQLREHWDTFKQVAEGELQFDKLPTWSNEPPPTSTSDFDDDIPF